MMMMMMMYEKQQEKMQQEKMQQKHEIDDMRMDQLPIYLSIFTTTTSPLVTT